MSSGVANTNTPVSRKRCGSSAAICDRDRVCVRCSFLRSVSKAYCDDYEVRLFHNAACEYPKLAELLASARERLFTAPALIACYEQ